MLPPSDRLVPLSWERHSGLMWQRFKDYGFAADLSFVPLAAEELSLAVQGMPIAFHRGADGWQVVAVLGLHSGENRLLDARYHWRGRYIPAALRGHPFAIRPGDPDTLCLYEDSEQVISGYDGEPFFDESGDFARFVVQIHAFLKTYESGRQRLAPIVRRLDAVSVLVPYHSSTLDAPLPDLYRIDETRWNALPDRAFLACRRGGALPIVYAHLLSQPQQAWLMRREPDASSVQASETQEKPVLTSLRTALEEELHYEWKFPE